MDKKNSVTEVLTMNVVKREYKFKPVPTKIKASKIVNTLKSTPVVETEEVCHDGYVEKKLCIETLRTRIADLQIKEDKKFEEYNALRARGIFPDPVQESNLLHLLIFLLDYRLDEEAELAEQDLPKPTKPENSFFYTMLCSGSCSRSASQSLLSSDSSSSPR